MTANPHPAPRLALERLLCILVMVIIVLATLYAGWVGIINFSRIHV